MLHHFIILFSLCYVSCQNLRLSEGSSCTWNGVEGQCVSVFRCLSAVMDIEKKDFPPICTFNDKTPIICCTDCKLVDDTRLLLFNPVLGILTRSGTNKAKDKCLEFIHRLDYDCKKYTPLIISSKNLDSDKQCTMFEQHHPPFGAGRGGSGGIAAKRGEFPHMKQLVPECLDYIHKVDYPCKNHGSELRFSKLVDPDENCTRTDVIPTQINVAQAAGGVNASRQEYPHMALLGYGESADEASWLCGGSVISERFILTAAHCLSGPSVGPVKFIALGILQRSDPSELWQMYNVKNSFRYPEYKPPSKYHDIALLETDREIAFNSQVRPACLHIDDMVDNYAVATGWGALGHRKDLADILQAVGLHKFSDEECLGYYPPHRHLVSGYDQNTQMCYGDRKDTAIPTDTCEGDSGGPLQSQAHEQCVYTILGVTSYGRQCGVSGGSGMYTRVSHYVRWIEDIVWP